MIPSNTKFFNVINKISSSRKTFFIRKHRTMLVFKVGLKVSKLEIKNVFIKIFLLKKIKIRTLIIKKLIKNKKKICSKYNFFKKAYVTIVNNIKN